MSFLRIQYFMVMALMATTLSAFAGTVTANFTSASTIPVTAASYTATGNDVNFSLGFAPPTGTNLTVVENTGLGFISGKFSNLAQGQKIGLTHGGLTYEFVANYYGGTGNDLVLQWAYQDVAAWGYNRSGQLGNNSTTASSVLVAVTNNGVLVGKTVVAVAAGNSHSLAICSDGTVAAWGYNNYGQLGNSSTTDSKVPVAVDNSGVLAGKTVVAVAAGDSHSLALCSDGTVAAWGNNFYGQLGNNSTTHSKVPVAVTTTGVLAGKTVVAVAAGGEHSLALCSDGTVAAWGTNSSGQLGNNSTTNSLVPVAVTNTGVLAGKTVVAVAVGSAHSLALCSDGTLAAWGFNGNQGQLGNNSTTSSSVPVAVINVGVLAGKTVVLVAAGVAHSLVLCSDGTVAAWGYNANGQLGNNSTTNSRVPVAVVNSGVLVGKTVVAVAAGGEHSLALCSDGTVAAWGWGGTTGSRVPLAVDNSGMLASNTVVAVAAGGSHSLAIAVSPVSEDSTLSSLTLDSSALYPVFSPTTATYSASVPNSTTSMTVTPTVNNRYATVKVNGVTVSSGSTSGAIALAVGSNTISVVVTAQNGINSSNYTINVLRTSDLNFTYTAADQTAVTFPGYVVTGNAVNLSLGYTPQPGTDLMLINNPGLNFISGRFNNLAQGQKIGLTYGGLTYEFVANYYGGSGNDLVLQWAYRDVYAWGYNNYGQLGNNSTTDSKVPVAVTNAGVLAGKTVVAVAGQFSHSLALCSDGTVAAWGDNAYGQLGNNSTTGSSVPVAVVNTGVLAGKTVIAVAAGRYHSLALCSDGTVTEWGFTTGSVPVVVTNAGVLAGKTVVAVAAGEEHSLALCSDGTVAAWGRSTFGVLGSTQGNGSVPLAVDITGVLAGKTVVAVAAGNMHSLALCSDGTVAAWGANYQWQLGNDSMTTSSVPVAVLPRGALTGKTVVVVAAGGSHSLAICSDGTVAAWGDNGNGQLGNNSTTISSIPVAVTSNGVLAGKTLVAVAGGLSHSLALCSDGTVAAWGANYYGQLGDNSTTNSSVPVAMIHTGVLIGKTTVALAPVGAHTLAIQASSQTADSTLSSMKLDSVAMYPAFAPATNAYSASVPNSTTSMAVTPIVTNSYASVKVNGTSIISGNASPAIPLTVGSNTLTVMVTAQDGGTASYIVTVMRAPSSVSTLSTLSLSSGTLNPVFAPTMTNYTASVPNGTTSISVTPAVTDPTSSIKVNGSFVVSGRSSQSIPLVVGQNIITALVTAEDGTTTTSYSITVTRISNVATLAGLALSSGTLSSAFNPSSTFYTANVTNTTASITVTPTVTDTTATVEVNGLTVVTGSASSSIPLVVGTNTITTVVTAQDGTTTKTYTVTITRISSVATLAGLALSSGTLSPSFSTGTMTYTASVLSSVKSLQVTPTVTDSIASVKVNGLAVASGSASLPISLSAGNNPIQVVVTAQDGSTISNYTVTVFLPLAVTTLSGLTCNSGSLSPTFTSGTTAYAVNVANDCTGVTLTPTVAEPNATMRVNGTLVGSGTASIKIPVLASGSNVINVVVTAQDGTTTQTYAVNVNRPPLSANFASATTVPLSVSSYDATGNFANLSLSYAPTPGTTLTLVKLTGLGFIQGRFTNLAQGQYVSLVYQGVVYRFVVNYYGGTGNDLVLQWANDQTYAWGANSYGQLGNNGTSNSSLPTPVLGSGALSGKTVVAVSAGSFHSLALCADGTLVAWGRNDLGQLGNNSTTSSSVPVAITNSGALSGKTVVAVSAGYYHNLALCSDGTMVAWGQNTYGQLGDGSKTNRSVPVAVSAAGGLSGKTVSGIAAGYYHNLAQCTDGSLVAWGRNTYGQLGNNSTTDSSAPVDITSLGVLNGLTVAQFAAGSDHSLVLCTDGSLAAWGRNNYGQLGEGSGANSSVPVEVDSTDVLAGKIVTSISAGGWHNLALCSDGTLAAFGRNTSGQLGDGGTTNSGLPLMANLSGLGGKAIAAVQAANGHSLALCADGSIYAWGSNNNGQLGNGGTTNSSSPVAVTTSPLGSGERFMTLATGTSASHSMALVAALPTNSGFSVWAAGHAGLPDSTALGDPDKDGIPNVLEYVLHGNPAVASAGVLPVVSQNASSFLFSFSRAVASVADTTQVFQYSTDLNHWTELSLTPPTDAQVTLGAEDGAGIQPVTVTIPKAANSPMFGRLKVTQP